MICEGGGGDLRGEFAFPHGGTSYLTPTVLKNLNYMTLYVTMATVSLHCKDNDNYHMQRSPQNFPKT